MCGIYGIVTSKQSSFQPALLRRTLEQLAVLAQTRGKDSSGLAFQDAREQRLEILKGPLPISRLLKTPEYRNTVCSILDGAETRTGFAAFGHARLVTNGSQLNDENNQPVVKDGIVAVHNGIITNHQSLWSENADLERQFEIDTEIILALMARFMNQGSSLAQAVAGTLKMVQGTVAMAMFFAGRGDMVLTTNNGSLYILTDNKDMLVFASERFMLRELLRDRRLQRILGNSQIRQLLPGSGLVVNLDSLNMQTFHTQEGQDTIYRTSSTFESPFKTHIINVPGDSRQKTVIIDPGAISAGPRAAYEEKLLEYNIQEIRQLRRCSCCLLPETFPFISYDKNGVCNYCRNYKPRNRPRPIEELINLVEPYRGTGEPDVIVPFSGGRDSTFVLHTVKRVLNLNPIAYTYDWGMVTDLARRNIARTCGKLGVENIIVSADIRKKRENIRKNIIAWLKRPTLGMIPLFMAGDKYFFYYCNQVKKQTGINLNIWGINYLENTDFKTGFAGLRPQFNKKRIYSLSLINQFKLFGFIGRQLLRSPSYLNTSILDTFGSFVTRYIEPKKDYYHLFDYYRWDEKEVENVILNEYDWERATDTDSTWRIGDGTASFYNYVYYTIAGFSENETFRSNQIREGMLTRDEAIGIVERENQPRYESIKWYLEIVGLDFEDTIRKINRIPKLYD